MHILKSFVRLLIAATLLVAFAGLVSCNKDNDAEEVTVVETET